jgi:hypothetical protein
MAFPVAALIGVAPQIIRAVGSLFSKKGRKDHSSKVKAGSAAAAIVAAIMIGLRAAGAPVDEYPGLSDAMIVVAMFVAGWIQVERRA